MAYATEIDLVAYGRRQGKIQMVDALLALPAHIDSLKIGTDDFGNKLVPIEIPGEK